MYKEQTLKTICCTVVYAKQIFFSFTIMFLANTLVEKSTDPEVHLVVSWFPPVPAPAIYLNHQTFITHFLEGYRHSYKMLACEESIR